MAMWKRPRVEGRKVMPCRYTEAFQLAARELEEQLEGKLQANLRELQEKQGEWELALRQPGFKGAVGRLEATQRARVRLQGVMGRGVRCPRCRVVPSGGPVHLCTSGHLLCRECHPSQGNSCYTCGARSSSFTVISIMFSSRCSSSSLLAVTVATSITRECTNKGCTAPYDPCQPDMHRCRTAGETGFTAGKGTRKRAVNQLTEAQEKLSELENTLKEVDFRQNEELAHFNKKLVPLNEMKLLVAQEERELEELEEVLASSLECPVCMEVPTAVPGCRVRSCTNGHLLCSPCYLAMGGREAPCPSCRATMGDNTSLLAQMIVRNIRHKCGNIGCSLKLPYNAVKAHRTACGRASEMRNSKKPRNTENTGFSTEERNGCLTGFSFSIT